MTKGDFLDLLVARAKAARKTLSDKAKKDRHLTGYTGVRKPSQETVDAILTAFINETASELGVDYAVKASDIPTHKATAKLDEAKPEPAKGHRNIFVGVGNGPVAFLVMDHTTFLVDDETKKAVGLPHEMVAQLGQALRFKEEKTEEIVS